MRPFKSDVRRIVETTLRGEISAKEARGDIEALARDVPGLDEREYALHVAGMLACRSERAYQMVDSFGDYHMRPWVRRTCEVSWWLVRMAAFALLAFVVAWYATR